MVNVNIELIGAMLGMLTTLTLAIVAIVKVYSGAIKSINKLAYSVDTMNDKIDRLEGYDKRISKNEQDIAVIQNTCNIYHKEV